MTDEREKTHLLYKKIGAGGGPGGGSNADLRRAFRMVVARAAEDFSGMLAVLRGLARSERSMDELVDDLAEVPVVFVLEGPQEAMAMAIMDHNLIAGLLEHATTGRVISGPAEARPTTRTDANICAEFLDRVIDGLAAEFADGNEGPNVAGFKFAFTLADARAVEMAFENMAHSVYTMSLDLENNAKTGELKLIWPTSPPGGRIATGTAPKSWAEAWLAQVEHAPVQLEAILGHKQFKLAEISEFAEGHLVKLSDASLGNVTLVGQNGQIVARGKLGRQGADKAIRVEAVTDEAYSEKGAADPFQPGAGAGLAMPEGLPPPMPAAAPMANPAPLDIAPMPAAAPPPLPGGGEMAPMASPMPSPLPDMAPIGADAGGLPRIEEGEAPGLPPLPMGAAPMPMAALPETPDG